MTTYVQVDWPAPYQWQTKLEHGRGRIGPASWVGSLIEGGRDLTGQLYMRNRFYDPQSGKFTQEDPIGIAGGLNVYGFASGDPVNYSDPYGLCPEDLRNEDGTCPGGITVDEWKAVERTSENMDVADRLHIKGLLWSGDIKGGEPPRHRVWKRQLKRTWDHLHQPNA